ncbi:hypothetical protein A2316_01745 [Candidatus Falkowbacteria bacterium RIFOXYB2_FULL_38_15]|uniref:Uncharacterized protein n=1 Tax=Candidatus Falkowbacteria bacterium RIFOXYA2_FULL_38_12 TaxID=1797993 RepID=A0A1F5S294_9BACT|nr:MAG: hypothetical protein A2257_03525 [Candidatus Falkowbacteria bacterium RIFOXYA2_FULL_38_12]OGF32675.1 MAG: hypothetical protein A2316_01745 [Candidatus Falkowbacteria bacterium RIFOXYB2_FULL_38_15]OGF42079.1 MAG: hypothetical protein A2555_01640 [Candidatus Falkowbacteria bacterium RIFOXYD2_FULL_39_16]
MSKKYLFVICTALIFSTFFSLYGAKIAKALSGVYIYANNGGYYRQYGPLAYWYTRNGEGYCGHLSSCSPAYMKYTYTAGCIGSTNSAVWDNIDSPQYGTHKIFVPRVNATTRSAPYLITYNGASSYSRSLNQYAYSDAWITTARLFDIRNTWLSDNTCEAGRYQIGFDEIQILY